MYWLALILFETSNQSDLAKSIFNQPGHQTYTTAFAASAAPQQTQRLETFSFQCFRGGRSAFLANLLFFTSQIQKTYGFARVLLFQAAWQPESTCINENMVQKRPNLLNYENMHPKISCNLANFRFNSGCLCSLA
jgi:hypothetical protein